MKRLLAVGAAIGAALTWFLDPQNGVRRRNVTRDRIVAFFRKGGRHAERAERAVASEAHGLKQKATHRREEETSQRDDVTLARKVESEIFHSASAAKGKVDVNAEGGVVFLRGEVDDERMIKDLELAARNVQGVREVENLLHVPGTPMPAQR